MVGQNSKLNKSIILEHIKSSFESSTFSKDFRNHCSNLLDLLEAEEQTFVNNHIHPLGFYTLKISEWEDGTSLKIHIWADSKRPLKSKMTIHKHNSNLKSYILCGNIQNIEYDLFNTLKNKEYVVYNCNINNGERTLFKSEKGGVLKVITNDKYDAGQIYKIRGEHYHESIVKNNNFTATLIYSFSNELPTVIGKAKSRKVVKTVKKVCDLNLIKNLLHKVNRKYKELT